ncbi:MAG: hypothetical protein K9G49_07695 [Taibaiella sp.]|nr:hypothetical protein [Taibaiella sp.]
MKHLILVPFFLLISICSFAQFSMFERAPYVKPYTIAITATNPLSAMIKYGGGIEFRRKRVAYLASYHKYVGAYYGTQYDFENRIYFRKQWMHIYNKWIYQDFFYFRTVVGDMAYDGEKFAVLGMKEKRYADPQFYAGFAPGYGRRHQKGAFFFTAKAGVRAMAIPALDKQIKSLYRLFYVTGPGSIIELNFQAGLQF